MNFESCEIKPVDVKIPVNKGLENGIWDEPNYDAEYRFCKSCYSRLLNFALRPLEYFNLALIHGHTFYLHDEFYDYRTGEASQPKIEVKEIDRYRFPGFTELKNDLSKLINYSIVQLYTDKEVITQLKKFHIKELIKILKNKVDYNRSINYKAYEIAGKVAKSHSYDWIREEWRSRRNNELEIFAEPIANSFKPDEAIKVITQELESKDDNYLAEKVSVLIYLQSPKVLNWIESV